MQNTRASVRYAKSLLTLSIEKKVLDVVKADIDMVCKSFDEFIRVSKLYICSWFLVEIIFIDLSSIWVFNDPSKKEVSIPKLIICGLALGDIFEKNGVARRRNA